MTRRPRYLALVLAHLEAQRPKPGTFVHVEVRHDDDCALWDGGDCNCEPEIETGQRVDRKYGRPR